MSRQEQSEHSAKVAEIVTMRSSVAGDYEILSLTGKMVYENAGTFTKALETKIQKNTCYIIDVDGLERLDSTGMGVLINFSKKVAAAGGQIGFKVSDKFMKELFVIAKFDCVFPIAADLEAVWKMIRTGFQPNISLTQY